MSKPNVYRKIQIYGMGQSDFYLTLTQITFPTHFNESPLDARLADMTHSGHGQEDRFGMFQTWPCEGHFLQKHQRVQYCIIFAVHFNQEISMKMECYLMSLSKHCCLFILYREEPFFLISFFLIFLEVFKEIVSAIQEYLFMTGLGRNCRRIALQLCQVGKGSSNTQVLPVQPFLHVKEERACS